MEEWLTTYEAARLADFAPDCIRKLVCAKKVKARKWDRAWQVYRESLLEYVKASKAKGGKRGPKRIDSA